MTHPSTLFDFTIFFGFFRELQAIENGETDPVIGQNALKGAR